MSAWRVRKRRGPRGPNGRPTSECKKRGKGPPLLRPAVRGSIPRPRRSCRRACPCTPLRTRRTACPLRCTSLLRCRSAAGGNRGFTPAASSSPAVDGLPLVASGCSVAGDDSEHYLFCSVFPKRMFWLHCQEEQSCWLAEVGGCKQQATGGGLGFEDVISRRGVGIHGCFGFSSPRSKTHAMRQISEFRAWIHTTNASSQPCLQRVVWLLDTRELAAANWMGK